MRPILKGSLSQSVDVRIVDDTTGQPETAVVFNTSGIAFWYRRQLSLKVAITLATLSAQTDAWTSGGFLHIGDGYYRVDVPDAAFATGSNNVLVGGTVTGMVVLGANHPLVDYNPYDANALGLTTLGRLTAGFGRAVKGNVIGTVGSGSTTTSINISSLAPPAVVTDQFKGRVVTFADDTTTAALRGQASDITGNSTTALTVTALTTGNAPVTGDTFAIT